LLIDLAEASEVAAAFSGSCVPPAVAGATVDGAPWSVERGEAGDLLMTYDDCVTFHLDSAATHLLCAPSDPSGTRWQRVLLDSCLTTAALQRGHEALHAGAVLVNGKAVAISGRTGAGKTTLVNELLSRGHELVTDDILVLSHQGDVILAHPGPPLMNVPAAADPSTRGEVLAELDDGAWVKLPATATEPVRLAAIYILQRGAGERNAIVEVADPATFLLGLGLDSGSSPQRRLARFDLLSTVASAVPVRRLTADLTTSPAELANMIEC
jgi:hypothetical protein